MQALFQLPSPEPDVPLSRHPALQEAQQHTLNRDSRPYLTAFRSVGSRYSLIPSHATGVVSSVRRTGSSAFRVAHSRSEPPPCPTSPRRRLSRPLTSYWGSVTVGLASRRPSHVPYTIHVIDSRRRLIHNLPRSRSSVP